MKDTGKTVLFIFLKGNKVLLEQRLENADLGNKIIFPGGKIEENEVNDLEKALFREVLEEVSVIPVQYQQLVFLEPLIQPSNGRTLIPFLITKWEGNIPKTVIDKGNPFIWKSIKTFKPELKTTSIIIENIKGIMSHNS
jgi:mutator protein MutT